LTWNAVGSASLASGCLAASNRAFRYGAGHCRVAKNLVDSVGYGSVSWRVARRTIRPQNGLRDAGLVS
jgi:hypothetical protein